MTPNHREWDFRRRRSNISQIGIISKATGVPQSYCIIYVDNFTGE
jgi:hypothetical protein